MRQISTSNTHSDVIKQRKNLCTLIIPHADEQMTEIVVKKLISKQKNSKFTKRCGCSPFRLVIFKRYRLASFVRKSRCNVRLFKLLQQKDVQCFMHDCLSNAQLSFCMLYM